MKKIVAIIDLPPVNLAYELLIEFKLERRNLKRYLASMRLFRQQIEENVQMMNAMSNEFTAMKISQSKPRKKTSRIDYFMFSGTKVYGGLCAIQDKLAFFYANLLK